VQSCGRAGVDSVLRADPRALPAHTAVLPVPGRKVKRVPDRGQRYDSPPEEASPITVSVRAFSGLVDSANVAALGHAHSSSRVRDAERVYEH
jgi:hypothetical protein